MLRSMTGYGAADGEAGGMTVRVEVRSVNQRYLELAFHMPTQLAFAEPALRKLSRQYLRRGKVDFYIRYASEGGTASKVVVNEGLVRAYHAALEKISDMLRETRPDDVLAIASYPDVLSLEESAMPDGFETLLLQTAETALSHLDAMRQEEGSHIGEDFAGRLATLRSLTGDLEALAPEITKAYREHLAAAMQELLGDREIDEARLLQEVAIFADKVDFTEELVRLSSHFKQFESLLAADEPIGRKLDFLLQEMNRETNTIGSKADSAEAARLVVTMKSELEKIREQVQNIE